MSRKLKAASVLAATLMLLPGCGDRESPPISEDLAYEYVWCLEDYVAETGDYLILHDRLLDDMDIQLLLESIDRDLLLEFVESDLIDAYAEGWSDCEKEYEDRRDNWYWDGYWEGEIDGYAFGYAHGSGGVPYDETMIRSYDTGYIPQE